VLIAGGSRGMIGAPCLAARAAYRGGAGLVKLAVPESLWDLAAVKLDETLTAGLPETPLGTFSQSALEPLLELAAWADVVVLGPGLSAHPETARLTRLALARINRPVVLDADGLNAFAAIGSAQPDARGPLGQLAAAQAALPRRPLILTPHPGEMARLLATSPQAVQRNRPKAARECARAARAVVVLKGAGTLVADGKRLFVNPTGNPGMASGGTGDVLAGLLAALIGQKLAPYAAACLAVYLHGLAGDLAARRLGLWSVTAGDVLAALPAAFLEYSLQRPGIRR
jgi:NAD(P)H-hydrate epimerase